jgi:hypothetical protein
MGEVKKERIFGNFKQKGYAREKTGNAKRYKKRPGMSPEHLDSVRNLPCCICLQPPRNEAHHLKQGTGERGMGLRSTDRHAVPLCRSHHQEVELAGSRREANWFLLRSIDALALADALWAARGNALQQAKILMAHRQGQTDEKHRLEQDDV